VLWRTIITRRGGQLTGGLDISSLAKVSDGYTAGMIDQVCSTVLIERRVNQLTKKPLAGIEFIAPLARLDPIYKEEEEMFKVRLLSFLFVCQLDPLYFLSRTVSVSGI